MTSIGNQARGMVILGPISACVNNAGVGYTCANSGTAAGVDRRVLQFRHHHASSASRFPITSSEAISRAAAPW